MQLIHCRQCGNSFVDTAIWCPRCGAVYKNPLVRTMLLVTIGLTAVIALVGQILGYLI